MGGAIAWFWVGRQRFRRRNEAGIEEFASYGGMLLTKVLEKLLRLCAVVAVLAGLALMARAVNSNMASLASARKAASPSSAPAEANQDKRPDRRSPLQGK